MLDSWKSLLVVSVFLLLWSSCEEDYTPKQKGYPRVKFPAKNYITYKTAAPFTFEYADCAVIKSDTSLFGEHPDNPWWFNIYYPLFEARIHFVYKEIGKNNNTFKSLLEDTYELSFKHTVKAESIDRANLHPGPHIGGQLFKVAGNAASSYQFFLTDSTRHFVRGALYFYCEPNADSLAPINKYIYRDIEQFIATFRFVN